MLGLAASIRMTVPSVSWCFILSRRVRAVCEIAHCGPGTRIADAGSACPCSLTQQTTACRVQKSAGSACPCSLTYFLPSSSSSCTVHSDDVTDPLPRLQPEASLEQNFPSRTQAVRSDDVTDPLPRLQPEASLARNFPFLGNGKLGLGNTQVTRYTCTP